VRVGLNATCFNGRPSGAKQRFLGLYGELFKIMPDTQFIIFEPRDYSFKFHFHNFQNVKCIKTILPSEGRIKKALLGFLFWPIFLRLQKLDILEGFNLPSISHPNVYTFHTIHDVRSTNNNFSGWEYFIALPLHRRSIHRVNHIITVSHSMKKEIQNLDVSTPITVIYNGISDSYSDDFKNEDILKVKEKFNINDNFFLSVGHFEKRKNYLNLIKTMKLLKDDGFNIPLFIIGNDNGEKKAVLDLVEEFDLIGQVFILSHLSNLEVKVFYSLASLFIFPSLYEGFGIPILEAMSSKTPIVMSDLEVFKELTNEKYVYFDPHDVSSMVEKIKFVLNNPKVTETFRDFGSKRVNDFTFDGLAVQLKSLYDQVKESNHLQ